MPPKSKSKTSSKKNKNNQKESTNNTINNNKNNTTEWDDMDIPQLEQYITTLSNKYQSSLQERIRFQTEYESIYQSYYEATKQNVTTMEMKIKAKQMEIEDMINDFNVEIDVYGEKEQFIRYDHEQKLNHVNEERIQYKNNQESKNEMELLQQEEHQLALKMEMKERGIVFIEEVKNTRDKYRRELNETRDRLDLQLKSLEDSCMNENKDIQDALNAHTDHEMSIMKEQNNLHMKELEERHQERYKDAHAYFNNISKENNVKIQGLTDECEKVERRISDYERQINALQEENQQLSGPLAEYRSKFHTMKGQMKGKEQDRLSSISMKSRKITMEEKIRLQSKEISDLQRKYDEVENEIVRLKQVNISTSLDNSIQKGQCADFEINRFNDLSSLMKNLDISIDKFLLQNSQNGHNSSRIIGQSKQCKMKAHMTKGNQNHDETFVTNSSGVLEDADKVIKVLVSVTS